MYFTPRQYAFEPFSSTPGEGPVEPVVVVGAGPVGLAVALGLVHRGVPVTILEAGNSVSFGSRAICLSRHSPEVLDRLGVGEQFLKLSLPWTRGRSYYRADEVLVFDMPNAAHDVRPPMVNISQSVAEQILVDALQNSPDCRIRWQCRVTGARQEADHVVLEVDTPEGPRQLRTSWVVAADGARSTVREALGLRLAGTSYEGRYVIADIRWPTDLPTERRVWFDPPSNPGSTLIMHRQPDDIWRIDYQLGPEEDPEVEVQEERVRARIDRHLDWLGNSIPWTLEWVSIYRAHQLSLHRYVHGRVVFAGDAAHLVPIFGVRGLNSGLEDAENLAWKLALVVAGTADPDLLDSYDLERRDAWRQNVEQAEKSTRFMTPGSHGYAATRDAVLALTRRRPVLRQLINPRQSSATHARISPLNWSSEDAGEAELQPGDPVEDRKVVLAGPAGPAPSSLQRAWGTGFALVGVGIDPEQLGAAAARLQTRLGSTVSVSSVLVSSGDGSGHTRRDDVAVVTDADGTLARALSAAAGDVLVMRPDGLLLARCRAHELGLLDAVADRLLAGGTPMTTNPGPAHPHLAPTQAALDAELIWQDLSKTLDATSPSEREGFLTRLVLLLALDHDNPKHFHTDLTEALGAGQQRSDQLGEPREDVKGGTSSRDRPRAGSTGAGDQKAGAGMPETSGAVPRDQAPAGASQTGENTCPACAGSGRVRGEACATCGGSGVVLETVGDA